MTLVTVWLCKTEGCPVRAFTPGPMCPHCHRRGTAVIPDPPRP